MYQNLVLAKNKLRKFQQISSYNHVFEPTTEVLKSEYHLKGKWKSEVFKNNNRIRVSNKSNLEECLFASNNDGLKSIYPN